MANFIFICNSNTCPQFWSPCTYVHVSLMCMHVCDGLYKHSNYYLQRCFPTDVVPQPPTKKRTILNYHWSFTFYNVCVCFISQFLSAWSYFCGFDDSSARFCRIITVKSYFISHSCFLINKNDADHDVDGVLYSYSQTAIQWLSSCFD